MTRFPLLPPWILPQKPTNVTAALQVSAQDVGHTSFIFTTNCKNESLNMRKREGLQLFSLPFPLGENKSLSLITRSGQHVLRCLRWECLLTPGRAFSTSGLFLSVFYLLELAQPLCTWGNGYVLWRSWI